MGQKNASLKDGIGLMERENEQRKGMLLGYIKHREEMMETSHRLVSTMKGSQFVVNLDPQSGMAGLSSGCGKGMTGANGCLGDVDVNVPKMDVKWGDQNPGRLAGSPSSHSMRSLMRLESGRSERAGEAAVYKCMRSPRNRSLSAEEQNMA